MQGDVWGCLLSDCLIVQLDLTHVLKSLRSFSLLLMQAMSVSSHVDAPMILSVHLS
jgi:hypothetical protein